MERLSEGPCYICRVTTAERCSSCAQHSFDLFLCGREHQKLVWFAHKMFCGVNANPFRFPSVSKEDFNKAQQHLQETVFIGSTQISIASVVMENCRCSLSQVSSYLTTFRGDGLDFLDPCERNGALCIVIRQILILKYRQKRAAMEHGSQEDSLNARMPPIELFDPLGSLSPPSASLSIVANVDPPRSFNPHSTCKSHDCWYEVEWYIRLQHALLIYFAVEYRYRQAGQRLLEVGSSPAALAELVKFKSWAKDGQDRMVDYVASVVEKEQWSAAKVEKTMKTLNHAFEIREQLS